MKKYISIFNLLSVLIITSCERSSDLDAEIENLKPTPNGSISYNNFTPSARQESSTPEISDLNNLDTGDDDEPRRDKQHWRIATDSVLYQLNFNEIKFDENIKKKYSTAIR